MWKTDHEREINTTEEIIFFYELLNLQYNRSLFIFIINIFIDITFIILIFIVWKTEYMEEMLMQYEVKVNRYKTTVGDIQKQIIGEEERQTWLQGIKVEKLTGML